MKTDHPIYLFLSTGPEAFRILSGGHQLDGDYRSRDVGAADHSRRARTDRERRRLLEHHPAGSGPTWAEARIDQAKEPEIDAWLDAIFDAESVEDLLR